MEPFDRAYQAQAMGTFAGGVQPRLADTTASRSLRSHMVCYGDVLDGVLSLVERVGLLADRMLGPELKQQTQDAPPNVPPAGACATLAAADERLNMLLGQLARQVGRLEGAIE